MKPQQAQAHPRRWSILAAIITVLVMTPLDASALNVALPVLQHEFHVNLGQVAWAVLAYLVVIGSMIIAAGRLGDLFGFRRVYLTGVIVFVASSIACGLAPGFGWLIAARVAQGVGACMIMALGPAIVTALFPATERGRALGMVGMGVACGLIAGPSIGGLLTNLIGWRAIFFINVPIGLAGGLWCWRTLPELAARESRLLDLQGALFAMIMLGSLMLALTQAESWGWDAPLTLGLFALSILAAIIFIMVERRHPEPLLTLSLFHNRVFTGANIASMMNYLGQYCVIFLTPFALENGLRLSPARAGLSMACLPVAVLVLAPLSGALSDRLGTRLLAVAGELVVVLGLIALAIVTPTLKLTLIIPSLILVGVGTGLFQSPNNSAVMGSVPRNHLGVGSSVLATMRNLGMAFGIAASSAVVALGRHFYTVIHRLPADAALLHGVRVGFLVGAAFALLGAITSAVREDRQPASADPVA